MAVLGFSYVLSIIFLNYTDSEVVPMNRHEAIWEKINHFSIGIFSKRSVCEKQNSQTTSF